MLYPFRAVEQPGGSQVVDDRRIRVLDEHASVACLTLEEPAVEPDHVTDRDALALAQLEVGHTVSGGGVDDAGALVHADHLRCVGHDEGEPVGSHVGEQRLVGQVDER